jgi:hypothetical protein
MPWPYPHIRTSDRTQDLLRSLIRQHGPQVLVISGTASAPAIVHLRPRLEFRPQPSNVVVGQVASCLVYADEGSISLCPHELLVLTPARVDGERLVSLITRPESEAEAQQRLFDRHVPVRSIVEPPLAVAF